MLTRRVSSVREEGPNNQLTAIRGRENEEVSAIEFGKKLEVRKSFEVTGRWVFQCLGLTGGMKKTR